MRRCSSLTPTTLGPGRVGNPLGFLLGSRHPKTKLRPRFYYVEPVSLDLSRLAHMMGCNNSAHRLHKAESQRERGEQKGPEGGDGTRAISPADECGHRTLCSSAPPPSPGKLWKKRSFRGGRVVKTRKRRAGTESVQ